MNCPKCKTTRLKPTKLEEGLPALGCGSCDGALVTLLYYRDWAERQPADEADAIAVTAEELTDTKVALNCPKCGKLMRKYRISGEHSHKLDLCGSCDEAWIDGGEWSLLKQLQLSNRVPAIFTDGWQKRVKEQATELARQQRFKTLLGDPDFEKADQLRQWLKDHPNRAQILFYINHS